MANPKAPLPDEDPWKKLKPKDVLLDPRFHGMSKEAKRYAVGKVWPEFNQAPIEDQDATIGQPIKYWEEYFRPEPPPEGPGIIENIGTGIKAAYEGAKQVFANRGEAAGEIKRVAQDVAGSFIKGQERLASTQAQTAISQIKPLPTDFGAPPDVEALAQQKRIRAFDAESSAYDYASARAAGLGPDAIGHWPSRDPKTGLLLKGRKHPTWIKTVEGEKQAGYEIFEKNGRYYSKPKDSPKYPLNIGEITDVSTFKSPPLGIVDYAKELRGKESLRKLPIVGSATEMAEAADIYRAAQNVESDRASAYDEKILSDYESDQLERGIRGTTLGYDIAKTIASIPGFALEFLATGFGFTASKAAVEKTITQALGKLAKNRALKAATKVAGFTAGVAAQQAVIPTRTITSTIERMTPSTSVTKDDKGAITEVLENKGDDFVTSLARAIPDMFIEYGSERAGAMIPGIGKLAQKIPGAEKIKALKAAVAARWFKLHPDKGWVDLLTQIREKSAWNGVLGEIFEERVADVSRDIAGVTTPEQWSATTRALTGVEGQPTGATPAEIRLKALQDMGRQLTVEGASFSVPGAVAKLASYLPAPGNPQNIDDIMAEVRKRAEEWRVASMPEEGGAVVGPVPEQFKTITPSEPIRGQKPVELPAELPPEPTGVMGAPAPAMPHEVEPLPKGVTYNGIQDQPDGSVRYLYTDAETGSTFAVAPGEPLGETITRKKEAFKAEDARLKQKMAEQEKPQGVVDNLPDATGVDVHEIPKYKIMLARAKEIGVADEIAQQLIDGKTPDEIATPEMVAKAKTGKAYVRMMAIAIKKMKVIPAKAEAKPAELPAELPAETTVTPEPQEDRWKLRQEENGIWSVYDSQTGHVQYQLKNRDDAEFKLLFMNALQATGRLSLDRVVDIPVGEMELDWLSQILGESAKDLTLKGNPPDDLKLGITEDDAEWIINALTDYSTHRWDIGRFHEHDDFAESFVERIKATAAMELGKSGLKEAPPTDIEATPSTETKALPAGPEEQPVTQESIPAKKTFTVQFRIGNEWSGNSVFFANREEAQAYGENKFANWTMPDEFRVVESDKPANYRWDPDKNDIVSSEQPVTPEVMPRKPIDDFIGKKIILRGGESKPGKPPEMGDQTGYLKMRSDGKTYYIAPSATSNSGDDLIDPDSAVIDLFGKPSTKVKAPSGRHPAEGKLPTEMTPEPVNAKADRKRQLQEAIRARLGAREEGVAEKTTKAKTGPSFEKLRNDPVIIENMVNWGEELYNSGITDPAEWHGEMFQFMEEIAEGLGLDFEPIFPATWEAVTGNEDYIGGTGGVYGTPDGISEGGVRGGGGGEAGGPTAGGGGGEVRPGATGERPDTRLPPDLTTESGAGGPTEKPDIASARRGARYSLKGKSPIVLTLAQRKEINARVEELVDQKNIGDSLTDEEKDLLRQYTGLGHMTEGGQGILFEDYTSYRIVEWMWDKLRAMEFPLEEILMADPAFGVGNFAGFAPASAKIIGTEINPVAAKAAQLLYTDAKIQNIPFEQLAPRRDIDLFITNVPFLESRGALKYADEAKEYEDIRTLHDFFFMKALDMTRPNGMVAFITSTGTMDGTGADKYKVRKEINKRAEFLGAYRTPSGEFQGNTQYQGSTDIIFLRRRTPEEVEAWTDAMYQPEFIESLAEEESPSGGKLSKWYVDHPEKAWGILKGGFGMQFSGQTGVQMFNDGQDPETKRWKYNTAKYDDARSTALSDEVKYEAKATSANWSQDESITERVVLAEKPQDMEAGTIVFYPVENRYGFASKDGNIYEAPELPVEGKTGERVKAGYELMLLTEELYSALRENDNAHADVLREQIKPKLKDYREKYSTKKVNPMGLPAEDRTLWSYLNGGPASRPFPFADPRVWRLAGLTDKDGNLSDIFKRNTIYLPPPTPRPFDNSSLVDTAKFVYEETGELNWDKVDELYASDTIDKDKPLQEQPAFSDLIGSDDFSVESLDVDGKPTLQINDEYMFGSIWPKIDTTLGMIDQINDPAFQSPYKDSLVNALESQLGKLQAALPDQATVTEVIDRSDPFSRYIPDAIVKDWTLGQFPGIRTIEKQFDAIAGRWFWSINDSERNNEDAEAWTADVTLPSGGTAQKKLTLDDIESYLNHHRPRRWVDTGKTDQDGNPILKSIPDETREAAYSKLSEVFRGWARERQVRFESVAATYNRHYRSFRERVYAAKQLNIPGLSSTFKGNALKVGDHQWQTIGRNAHEGAGIIAHGVGGGKTMSAIILSQYLKSVNKTSKPMLVVPPKVIKNWAYEILQLLPDARILDLSGMHKANRYKMLQRVAASDADFILIGLNAMTEIPIRKAYDYLMEDYRKYEARWKAAVDSKNRRAIKDLEKKLNKLAEKLSKMQDMKKTKTIYFEDLGVDTLILDEAHAYKNAPMFYGDMNEYMRQDSWSDRAADMVYKTRYLHERKGGRKGQGVFGLTATPTPNSPTEIYTMINYVAPDEWTSRGIMDAGDFLNQFGRIETIEIKQATGVPTTKTKVVGYKNLTELRTIYRRWIDYREIADLNIKRPEAEFNDVMLEPTDEVIEGCGFIASLWDFWKDSPREAMAEKITPATISTRARQLAVDPAILDPRTYQDQFGRPGSKLDSVLQSLLKNDTGENTQLIFCDLYRGGYQAADAPVEEDEEKASQGDLSDAEREQSSTHFVELVNAHKWFKKKLIEAGVPESQIAIINGEVNNTPVAKFKIQQANAEGTVRFLIGTTQSMGEGMNLQVNTTDIHDVDMGWNPSAAEQRHGRGVRQGNKNEIVNVHRYLVKGTYDAALYDIIGQKERWSRELWLGTEDEVIDFDENGRNFDQLATAASIPETTLNYYRNRRTIQTLTREIKEVEKELNEKLLPRVERHQHDIEYRTRQIEHYQSIIDSGEGTDWHRRTLQSHQDHIVTLQGELETAQAEASKARQDIENKQSSIASAQREIQIYEGAKKEGIGVDEYAAKHPEIVAALPIPEITPPAPEEGSAEKRVYTGIQEKPAGAQEGIEEKRKPRKTIPIEREVEPGPGYLLTIDVMPPDIKMLSNGFVPPNIIQKLAEEAIVELDPTTPVTKIRRGWMINADGRQFLLYTYEANTLDIYEKDSFTRIEIPELINVIEDLLGGIQDGTIKLNNRLRSSLGRFVFKGDRGHVEIRPDLYKAENREALARTVAHELGHLIDWLPDKTISRGNLIGRLKALRGFYQHTMKGILFKNGDFRKELIALSEYWDPYPVETASDDQIAYRRKPRELYADFISVLLNSPGTARRMAPKFYREFHAYLDLKPEVKEAYDKLTKMMQGSSEEAIEDRLRRGVDMLRSSEKLSVEAELEEKEHHRNFWKRFKDWLFSRYWESEAKTKTIEKGGVKVPYEMNPRLLFDEMAFKLQVDEWKHFDQVEKEVMQKILVPAGITADDMRFGDAKEGLPKGVEDPGPWGVHIALGLYMYLHRAATQRSNIANPKVVGGAYADETLDTLRARIGEEKFNALEQAAHAYTDLRWHMVQEAFDVGIYPERVRKNFEENKYNYSKFVAQQYISDHVGATVKRQIGFSGEIENPWISTLKMDATLIRLITVQKARQGLVNFLGEFYPEEIEEAKPQVPTDVISSYEDRSARNQGMIEIMRDGKMVPFYVDKYIADAVNNASPEGLDSIARWYKYFHQAWWKIIILYNLGFGAWGNIGRDFLSNYSLLPLETTLGPKDLWQLAKSYAKAAPHAWRWMRHAEDAEVQGMIDNYEWFVPMTKIVDAQTDSYHLLLQKAGVIDIKGEVRWPMLRKVMDVLSKPLKVLGFITEFGDLLGKVAGHEIRVAAGEKGKDLAFKMRRYTGTPAWYRKGRWTGTTNGIWPFSNIFLQGWIRTWDTATEPSTRSGYWLRTMKVLSLKLTMKILFSGAGGLLAYIVGKELADKITKAWKKITPYMQRNYFPILLGIGKDDQPFYLSVPLAEDQRLISGVLDSMIDAVAEKDPWMLQDIVQFVTNQFPSFNPLIQIGSAWGQYYGLNRNPTDSYRGLPLMPDQVFKAKDWEANWKLIQFTMNQLGLTQLQTFDTRDKNWYQIWTQVDPTIGRVAGRMFRYGGVGDIMETRREMVRKEREEARANRGLRGTSPTITEFYTKRSGIYRDEEALKYKQDQGGKYEQLTQRYPLAQWAPMMRTVSKDLLEQSKEIARIRRDESKSEAEREEQITRIKMQMTAQAQDALDAISGKNTEELPADFTNPPTIQ